MRCLLWFNPFVHLASTYFRADQELACDAAVLNEHPGSRRTYATAMLKAHLADAALPVGCHWHSAHSLKERLRMIKKSAPSRPRRTCGHLLVALTSVVVVCAAWAAEPSTIAATAVFTAPPTNVMLPASGTEIHGPKLKMMLGPDAKLSSQADRVSKGQDGIETLQGHVRIDASLLVVRRTPSGQVITTDRRGMIVEAEKAVITPQPSGVAKLEIENGFIRVL
jgi:hypothetical protein